MKTNNMYAVVFDNDEEFPGVLQFCTVNDKTQQPSSVTELLEEAKWICDLCKQNYPELNYRVVPVTLGEPVYGQN